MRARKGGAYYAVDMSEVASGKCAFKPTHCDAISPEDAEAKAVLCPCDNPEPSPCNEFLLLFQASGYGECNFETRTNFKCYADEDQTVELGEEYEIKWRGQTKKVSSIPKDCPQMALTIRPEGSEGGWESFSPSNVGICSGSDGPGGGPGGGTGGPGGGDDGGCDSEGNCGGGEPGGGEPGGGEPGGDEPGGGEPGGGEPGGDEPGGGGTGGGGTGGGGTGGNGDGDGDGVNVEPWTGDGGLGGLGSIEGMDKGVSDLEELVSDIMKGLMDNDTIRIIKGHKYITTTNAKCDLDITLFRRGHKISFCQYEEVLRRFGHILFGLISIMGFIYVLRS